VGKQFADVNVVNKGPHAGYGMGRHKLQTMNTHCRAIHPPPSPHVSA
jgi:hypothetical protein